MHDSLQSFLEDLGQFETDSTSQRSASMQRTSWIETASLDQIQALLESLCRCDVQTLNGASEPLLAVLLTRLAQRMRRGSRLSTEPTQIDGLCQVAARLYTHLRRDSTCRHQLLIALLMAGSNLTVDRFVELLVDDPPTKVEDVAQVFAPLFQRTDVDPSAMFPRLLRGLSQPSLAAVILDLANYVTRERLVAEHPAVGRTAQLATLLGNLSHRLGCLQENQHAAEETPEQLHEQVSESAALAVSLCDALALIGDRSVIGNLYQALELGHRRIHTEAAAALATLGEKQGEVELLKMASQPVVRLRTLAYAEELGLLERIEDQYKTPVARAEAELALCLAQPAQLGFPPTSSQLFDQCTQYWPGYDDPVECYLFRYSYELGANQYSNIGIAGPLTHAMTSDLEDLPPQAIYALFAGWQAEHEEIHEVDADQFNDVHATTVARLLRRIHDAGYGSIQPTMLGFFFGQRVLVATATHDRAAGLVVADSTDLFWYPTTETRRPLRPMDVYCIYKGKKLLRTFNP